jgi:UDPglucose--hexose-1-phosphate uridylyltransferase
VAVAPGRDRRPGARTPKAFDPAEGEDCPFCEGHESETPPEVLALAREGGGPDTPGWQVRVVPNLYPALARQEVVVHSPEHARSLAELSDERLALVAEAWSARAAAARSDGFPYVHALVNEGREAGASRGHSHSQLVWLREPPPEVVAETGEECRLCAHLADELAVGTRVLGDRGGVVAAVRWAGRLPYELLLAPVDHPGGSALETPLLPDALGLLATSVRHLHAAEGGPVPLNVWLHDGPHWHLEVVPRLNVLAGLELGAGIYVNTLDPDEAAERLRSATPSA